MDNQLHNNALNPNEAYYRFLVLFFNCMLTFGSYFCFDMPRNALVVIGSGILIDTLGQRVGAVLFSALCVVGSSVFAAGYFCKGGKAMFPLFLFGRLLFGAGNGSLTIAQNRISAFWFEGKELAFAFGMTLAFSRLGSIFNFLFTEVFESAYGIKWTLWGGAILCALGFFGSLVLFYLDKHGMENLQQDDDDDGGRVKRPAKRVQWRDIRYLSLQFWLLVLTTMLFYNTVFPFVADASKFIEQKYGYHGKTPAYIAGSVYDISLLLTPILGICVDYVGFRGILATACSFFTIPVFAILAFTYWHPLIGTLMLGATYSAAACSLWPSAPLVVNPDVLGTALGFMTSIQMIGIGSCNLIVGYILDKTDNDWKYVMLFLFGNAVACVVCSILLNIVDFKRGGVLNKTRKRRKRNTRPISEFAADTDALVGDDENSINT